jgi:hypothetical protein
MKTYNVTVAANAPVVKTFEVAADSQDEAEATMLRYLAGDEGINILGAHKKGGEISMEQQFDGATVKMKTDGWSVAVVAEPSFYLVDKIDTGEVRTAGSAN